MISLQPKRKTLDERKKLEVQASTESGSASARGNLSQRKRGFSLSKHHCMQFDRMYSPKDFIPQSSSKKIDMKMIETEKYISSNNLNRKNKIILKNVNSEKKLEIFRGETDSTRSRVSIGSYSKNSRNHEGQLVYYNELTYGSNEKVQRKDSELQENYLEYGLVRKK